MPTIDTFAGIADEMDAWLMVNAGVTVNSKCVHNLQMCATHLRVLDDRSDLTHDNHRWHVGMAGRFLNRATVATYNRNGSSQLASWGQRIAGLVG